MPDVAYAWLRLAESVPVLGGASARFPLRCGQAEGTSFTQRRSLA